jgi:hypothetical protein
MTMNKKYSFLVGITLLICVQSVGLCQIPNAGFENWLLGYPTGWLASNVPLVYTTISSSTTAHSGSLAARGEVVSYALTIIPPLLQSGTIGQGFLFSQRPTAFTGYYQFVPASGSGDRLGINVTLFKGGITGTIVGVAPALLSSTVTSYTQFSIPFGYVTSDTPDTCVIQFLIGGSGTGGSATPHVGSYFLVDDIAFTGVSGVADGKLSIPTDLALHQNYPNPFNPTTNISFTVPSDGRATLTVYTLLGQQIGTIFTGNVSTGTIYRATFNAAGLPSGVYLSRLNFMPSGSLSNSVQLMRKMTLIR